jgi:hypothetical protein
MKVEHEPLGRGHAYLAGIGPHVASAARLEAAGLGRDEKLVSHALTLASGRGTEGTNDRQRKLGGLSLSANCDLRIAYMR